LTIRVSANTTATAVVLAISGVALVAVLATDDIRQRFVSGDGIAQGALVAAIALGVVLTYLGSGVVNFASGTIAMYVAYVYAGLRAEGDLFVPPLPNPLAVVEGIAHGFQSTDTLDLPNLPSNLSLGGPMSFWPALALSLGFSVVLGLAIHWLVFRPLRAAPVLAKVVASVGLLLALQAIVIRRFTLTPRAVQPLPLVDKDQVDLGILSLTEEQLFVAVLVVGFAVVLHLVFRRTRFGLATRAAAENERGAVVLGFSPDRLAAVNWVLATTITGLLGIFVASINSNIEPRILPALVVPALTAALVGGFSSFGWTIVAAFLLGMQKPLIDYLGATRTWFPRAAAQPFPGVSLLIPLVVIVVVLFLRGNPLPERGAVRPSRLPFAPTPPTWALRYGGPALAVLAAVAGMFWFTPAFRGALANSLVGVVVCLSIVVLTGFVGQISLAQMTFAGFSAFTVSTLSVERGWPFPWPIFAGTLVALVAGMIIAVPALRVRGVSLAIVTFACAVAADTVVFRHPSVNDPLLGAPVDPPDWIDQNKGTTYELFGLQIGDAKLPNPMTAMFCLVAAVVLCYAVANLRRSTTGRQMLAVRSNERAAAAAGVSVAGTKLLGFALSASIAGIAGAIIAYRSSGASPDRFDYLQSLVFFAYAYLGGISSVTGAIIGGLIVSGGLLWTFLIEVVGISSDFTFLLGGIGLIAAAIFAPDGAAGRLRHSLRPPARPAALDRASSGAATLTPAVGAHTSTEQNRVGD
jgi:branched-chain amino acid transport system permease protein